MNISNILSYQDASGWSPTIIGSTIVLGAIGIVALRYFNGNPQFVELQNRFKALENEVKGLQDRVKTLESSKTDIISTSSSQVNDPTKRRIVFVLDHVENASKLNSLFKRLEQNQQEIISTDEYKDIKHRLQAEKDQPVICWVQFPGGRPKDELGNEIQALMKDFGESRFVLLLAWLQSDYDIKSDSMYALLANNFKDSNDSEKHQAPNDPKNPSFLARTHIIQTAHNLKLDSKDDPMNEEFVEKLKNDLYKRLRDITPKA